MSVAKSKTPAYTSWLGMKYRCLNPSAQAYKWYGAKGIKVFSEWVESFDTFIADVPYPAEGQGWTLERKDPKGHYEPGNVHWVEKSAQPRNRSKMKNNTSGICGVYSREIDGRCYWVARWYDSKRKSVTRTFSVLKWGDNARAMAVEAREKALQELESCGIVYGDQHGK